MYFDHRLWAMTAGLRWRLLTTVLLGLLAVVFGIARLALLGWLIGRVFAADPWIEVLWFGLIVVAVMIARALLEHYRAVFSHRTAAIIQNQLRQRLYTQITELGPAYFNRTRTGSVLLSLVEGVEQLEIYFGQYIPQLIVATLSPVLIFAVVVWLDVPIALVMLSFALLVLFLPALWQRREKEASFRHRRDYGEFANEFLDGLQGLVTLKAFGQSERWTLRLRERAERLFRSTVAVMASNTASRGITDAGIALGSAVAMSWGAIRVADGQMPIESLLIILMLGVEVFRPLRELRSLLHSGMVGLSAAHGIFEILEAKPELTAPPAPSRLRSLRPSIEFDDVYFSYPSGTRSQAHRGLSFVLNAGERVAVVGASGAGKSTIARLLLRFFDPDCGRILLGGCDLRSMSFEALYRQFAYVAQDGYLFFGTVEENLRMGRHDASIEALQAAARAANAHDFIEALPHGYQTVIGERGLRLSGGQRQRICIARALLCDAPILILDEAFSAVDADNEGQIQQALDRLMVNRTTLIFAHRLSSVLRADRILVLAEGKVVQSGNHHQLMSQDGVYRQLMSAQEEPRIGVGGAEIRPSSDRVAANPTGERSPERIDLDRSSESLSAWHTVKILFALIKPYRGELLTTLGLGLTRIAAFIGVGVLGALVIFALKTQSPFYAILIALLVIAPVAGILHWLESWVAHIMAYRLLGDMRVEFFRVIERLAPAYLLRRRSGDLLSIATRDIELVEYFFAHTVGPAFVAVVVPLAVLVTLSFHSIFLVLGLAPFLAYAGLAPVLARRRIDQFSSRAWRAAGDMNAEAVDAVQGLAEIIVYRQVSNRGAVLTAASERFTRERLPFLNDLSRQAVSQELVAGLGSLVIILIGSVLTIRGDVEAGYLPLLTLLAGAAFLPISEIAQVSRQFADTLAATRRLHAIECEPVAVSDGSQRCQTDDNGICVSAVRFAYPDRAYWALNDVTLSIAAGESLAVVGASGAGKSTLANLLLRFWDPQQGSITLGGCDLREFSLDSLRARVALVAQDTYLFNDSLRANILMARPQASDEELARAVKQAALGEFVASLSDGLETRVGERGAQLSGGQRQRVAIARAFLKDAPVLILDEATSQLDAISERTIRQALEKLMQGRTTIVIAHRLSTIRAADSIAVFEDGRLVEQGTHHSLMAKAGVYSHMVARQVSLAQSG